jgi:hypothetical protein
MNAAQANLQAAQTPQNINVWHSGTIHHDVSGTINQNVRVALPNPTWSNPSGW